MIQSFRVKDFKSIDDFTFNLKNLNLFTGHNSSGKSSAIQAFLLAVDNVDVPDYQHKLTSRHMGAPAFNEVRNYINNAKEFCVEIDGVKLIFTPADESMLSTDVVRTDESAEVFPAWMASPLFYLTANHETNVSTSKINPNSGFNPIGLKGEYVIDYYYHHKDEILPNSAIADDSQFTVASQLNYWLKKMTGYTLEVFPNGSVYEAKYKTASGKLLDPTHVGTGVSFLTVLIILALVSAIRGGILIVENPEIHLHPSAQAALIDFLNFVSKSGVQLIIESHSDHVFNGVRRLLHDNQLELDNVAVFSFNKPGETSSEITEVELSQEGGIRKYVPGLFEQFDLDLDAILSPL